VSLQKGYHGSQVLSDFLTVCCESVELSSVLNMAIRQDYLDQLEVLEYL